MTRKKILLVDDSNTALMMEKMLLGKAYEIVTASDGAQAIAVAAREQPDLILMDVIMPKMNGFEACRAIRAHEPTAKTPIILVTTRGEAVNRDQGFQSGCTDYVTKPINGPELLSKLKTLLGE